MTEYIVLCFVFVCT